MIAATSVLAAACFRYNPASRPDVEQSDSPSREVSPLDDARADTTALDDVTAIDDAALMDAGTDVEERDVAPDAPAMDAATTDVVAAPDALPDALPDVGADARADAAACVPRDGGADAGVAAGNCAVNNGGCSSFARCQQFCDGSRQCICGSGLALGGDGVSCSGLVLVSKTSIVTAGTNEETTNFDLSITRNGRRVAFVSIVESVLNTYRCFAADLAENTLTEIGATRDAMGRAQRPDACSAPLVTEDGARSLFVAGGLHPADPEAPPVWSMRDLVSTRWPYFRVNGGAPTRVNVWQHLLPSQIHEEGFNNFRFARDGRRMAFSTRSQPDLVLKPGDDMEIYSASIPIRAFEPLYENVNTNRTIAPFLAGRTNSRDLDLAGDGETLVFGTGRPLNGERHPGTDIFVRRIGFDTTTNPTINVTPDTSASGNSRWPTGSFDSSVVCFVSDSPGVGVTSGTQYVLSVRRGGGAPVFYPLGIPIPVPSDTVNPANSVSDDGTKLVVATNAPYTIPGQPDDTNNALDYYLFDITNPAMPRAMQRLNLSRAGAQPMLPHSSTVQARIAGDGNSVAFITTQSLVSEDVNGGGRDVYLRVFR